MTCRVQLASRKNDTRLSARAIRWWTNSIYSHDELVVDGVCYSSSAMDGGVRAKVINLNPDKWDVISLPWADAARVLAHYEKTQDDRYGWLGIIFNQVFNSGRSFSEAPFCSQWCAAALGIPAARIYNPGTLHAIGLWINEASWK